jgi:hypothetical protein
MPPAVRPALVGVAHTRAEQPGDLGDSPGHVDQEFWPDLASPFDELAVDERGAAPARASPAGEQERGNAVRALPVAASTSLLHLVCRASRC